MDWFERNFTGKPHLSWENHGKSMVSGEDFPFNQPIDPFFSMNKSIPNDCPGLSLHEGGHRFHQAVGDLHLLHSLTSGF